MLLHRAQRPVKSKFVRCCRNVEDYAREHEEASRNIQQYLSNPINAYLLVKRLTTDWKRVEELITQDVGKSFVANITNSRSDLKFPTDEDLNGAAVALMRLQDTYKLETAQVARGVLNGVQYSTGLSGSYTSAFFHPSFLFFVEVSPFIFFPPLDENLLLVFPLRRRCVFAFV